MTGLFQHWAILKLKFGDQEEPFLPCDSLLSFYDSMLFVCRGGARGWHLTPCRGKLTPRR